MFPFNSRKWVIVIEAAAPTVEAAHMVEDEAAEEEEVAEEAERKFPIFLKKIFFATPLKQTVVRKRTFMSSPRPVCLWILCLYYGENPGFPSSGFPRPNTFPGCVEVVCC
jgi:hypothetical protein